MSLNRKILPSIFIMLGLVLLTSCNKNASIKSSESLVASKGKAFFEYFDTVSYIYSYAGDSDEAFDVICQDISGILERYHRLFDIYHEYTGINNLCTINKNAGKDPVKVDPELIRFLDYAGNMYDLTEGEMNIAMGSVLSQWHEARSAQEHFVPQLEALTDSAEHISFDSIEIDYENSTVRLSDPKASLDVGALGKGYATEMAAHYFEDRNLSAYVLNIGGNVRIIGTKADGSGWKTGIRSPLNPDGAFALMLEISDCSCVTSGVYERYFTVDGVKYHHIIDKDTLFPAAYFSSVSVICHDSGLADALSTALFCMPYEKGLALVESLSDVDCVWILPNGEILYSEGLGSQIVE